MTANSVVTLEADTAKHIWQVLRMDEGDKLELTDGKGTVAHGDIQFVERHKCNVLIHDAQFMPRSGHLLHLCVGFTKNNARNEWLLEKATEFGVASITPVVSSRFQKAHIRMDRWEKILQSAILQSRQQYLPELYDLTPLEESLKRFDAVRQKLVAHCAADETKRPLHEMLNPGSDAVIFIGPEGDYSPEEVNLCIEHGYRTVSLSNQRLRTETAAMAVAAFYNVISDGSE